MTVTAPTERDRLTEEMCALTPSWGQAERIADAVIASDWYAERIAQARREGAADELDLLSNEAHHTVTTNWLRDRATLLRGDDA